MAKGIRPVVRMVEVAVQAVRNFDRSVGGLIGGEEILGAS